MAHRGRMTERKLLTAADAAIAADAIWERMTPDERHGVRFGLFPSWVMDSPAYELLDGHRLMAVALMEKAK